MKNFLKSFVICSLLALVGSMTTSCTPDGPEGGNDKWGTPSLKIVGEPTVHTAISVDVPVEGKYIKKLATLVKEIYKDENGVKYFVTGYDKVTKQPITASYAVPSANMVFRNGKAKPAGASFSTIHLDGNDGLDRSKSFEVFIAATISDTQYYNNGEVISVEFTTPDRYADDDVAVIRQNYEGMDVYVTFPEVVKAKGRRVKWGVTNIAMLEYNGNPPMPQLLHSCDYVYPASLFSRDTLLEINHYNAYRRNDKGEVGYYIIGNGYCTEVDPNSEDVKNGSAGPIQYYYNFQPGEPLVLLMSEVDYSDCDCESPESCGKQHPTIDWGWGKGWYTYPYDMQGYIDSSWHDLPSMSPGGSTSTVDAEKFWHADAWYRKIELRLPGPEQFNSSVNVEFSNLSTKDGSITFTPEGETYIYLVGIYEHTNEYQQGFIDITRDYFDGDESLWQWFTTAEMAPYFGIQAIEAAEGIVKINLSEYFTSLTAGTTYHVVVNALGKKKGSDGDYYADVSAQNFQHLTFSLKEYSLPEPELQITAVEPYSPWKVAFNVKNPNWKNNPIETVSFVANYARDFASFMKANDYTYTDMALMNAGLAGYQLSDADIEMVNSNAGATIEFDVFENSDFTAAFIGWNVEGRPSNPDSETYPGYATAKSMSVEPAEALDMTKLNALKGDWTASAQVKVYNAETGVHTLTNQTWKVTIGDLASPNALTQDLYDLFERHGVNKEAADAYFAEFKQQEAAYNQAVLGQNRVLCTGWAVDGDRGISTATPWDLFTMEDYNSSATSYLFHDFGPKWFLQVNEQGNFFIPVNYNRIAPLTSWYNGQAHYLCGGNYESGYAFPIHPMAEYKDSVEAAGLPVTISEDGNTVVISGFDVQIEDEEGNVSLLPMYPNVLYESTSGLAFYNSHVVSEVTLTRGWKNTASKFSVKGAGYYGKKVAAKNVNYTAPKRTYAITALTPQQPKAKVSTSKYRQVTPEETRRGMEKLMKKMQPAARK